MESTQSKPDAWPLSAPMVELKALYTSPWQPISLADTEQIVHNIQESRQSEVELITASYSKDEARVTSLLEEGVDPNLCDRNKNTAVMASILQSHTDILKQLIDKGASVNTWISSHHPLLLAVMTGRRRMVPLLVETGKARLDTTDQYGRSAVVLAALQGNLKMVECLHKLGADMNYESDTGINVLMAAVQGGSSAVVKYLVENGGFVDHTARNGLSSLMCAACQPDSDTLEYLVTHTNDVNRIDSQRNTAVMMAALTHNVHAVKTLLQVTAQVNIINGEGCTALDYVGKEAPQLAALLTEHGAKHASEITDAAENLTPDTTNDIEAIENSDADERYETALCQNVANGLVKVVEHLLERNVDVNCPNHQGQTPLTLAVINQDLTMVQLLCSKGADVDLADASGQTALMYSLSSLEILEYLLTCNINVNQQVRGELTALMSGCQQGNLDGIRTLLTYKASLDVRDMHGRTALMYCCLATRDVSKTAEEAVSVLVQHGAAVNDTDLQNNTALALALNHGNLGVARELLSHGADIDGCMNALPHGENIIIEAFHQGEMSVLHFILRNLSKVKQDTLGTALKYFFANLQKDVLDLYVSMETYGIFLLRNNTLFFKQCLSLAQSFLRDLETGFSKGFSKCTQDLSEVLVLLTEKVFHSNGFGSQLRQWAVAQGIYHCGNSLGQEMTGGAGTTLNRYTCTVMDTGDVLLGPVDCPDSTQQVMILEQVLKEKEDLIQARKKELDKLMECIRGMKEQNQQIEEKLLTVMDFVNEQMSLVPEPMDSTHSVSGMASTVNTAPAEPSTAPVTSAPASTHRPRAARASTTTASPSENPVFASLKDDLPSRKVTKQSDEELEVIKTPGVKRDEAGQPPIRPDGTHQCPNLLLLRSLSSTCPCHICHPPAADLDPVTPDQRLVSIMWLNTEPHPKLYLFKLHQSISQYTIDGSKQHSNACAIIAILFAYDYMKHPTPFRETLPMLDLPDTVFDQIEKAIREGNAIHQLNYDGAPVNLGADDVQLLLDDPKVKLVREVDVDTREPQTFISHVMQLKENQLLLFIKNERAVSLVPCNENQWLLFFDSHLHSIQGPNNNRSTFGTFVFYCKKEEPMIQKLFENYDHMVDPIPFYGTFALFEI